MYFEPLEILNNQESLVWPENLGELLKTDLFDSRANSRRRHLVESKISQLSLFDI